MFCALVTLKKSRRLYTVCVISLQLQAIGIHLCLLCQVSQKLIRWKSVLSITTSYTDKWVTHKMTWCRGQNIVFSMSALCKNLENLIFHSRLAIRSFIESESKGYLRLIFKLIPDFVHSFPDPFGIRRVSWNLKLLFCFRRRIYLVVYLLEVCQGGNSFGY